MHEAKTHLSRLVERALAGEEVVIARDGVPAVRLVPVPARGGPRNPGRLRGKIRLAEDFGAADAEIQRMFEGAGR